MTNPYRELEHNVRDNEWMIPQQEQIVGSDPGIMKALMEVWRDTANKLNALQMLLDQAREDNMLLQTDLQREQEATQELDKKWNEEKKRLNHSVQEREKQVKAEKGRSEKLRRHRDELADMVGQARKILGALKDDAEPSEVAIAVDLMRSTMQCEKRQADEGMPYA